MKKNISTWQLALMTAAAVISLRGLPMMAQEELTMFFYIFFATFLFKFHKATMEQCEIVATLYAVWNNRIIRQQEITDELLKADFLAWDPHKYKYRDRVMKALIWMRKENIIPVGETLLNKDKMKIRQIYVI